MSEIASTPHWLEAFYLAGAATIAGFFWELGAFGARHFETWLEHFGK